MAVFNQSFVFDMAQSEEPDRKRAYGFRKSMAIFGKIKLRIDMSRSQGGPKEVRAVIVFRDYLAGRQH